MKIPKAYFIITRYNEDISWINEYTTDYIIYNKGQALPNKYNVLTRENIGNNIGDFFYYFYNNYENMPELMCFLQGYPFDHCTKENFNELIYRTSFTVLQNKYHENIFGLKHDSNGLYETNSKYSNYGIWKSNDELMNTFFKDYIHEDKIYFPPGAQMIVERSKILKYSKNFWKHLNTFSTGINQYEMHGFERHMPKIVNAIYTPKDELC